MIAQLGVTRMLNTWELLIGEYKLQCVIQLNASAKHNVKNDTYNTELTIMWTQHLDNNVDI